MSKTDELLNQGIAALKTGHKEKARNLLTQAVQLDQQDETAWLWLSGAVETDEERYTCLENALTINPDNMTVQRGLEALRKNSPGLALESGVASVEKEVTPQSTRQTGTDVEFQRATSEEVNAILQQAVAAIKSDERKKGKELLIEALELDENNQVAWLWMTRCVADREVKRECFERVLSINPDNEHAIRGLKQLDGLKTRVSAMSPGKKTTPQRTRFLVGIGAVGLILAIALVGIWWATSSGDKANIPPYSPSPDEQALLLTTMPSQMPTNTLALPLPSGIQCVDCPRSFGSDIGKRSLRLDTNDLPHIAYGGKYLYYARHDGATWHIEIVDDTLGVGDGASLALDASGHPHISYYGYANKDLKYAHWTGDDWVIWTVAGIGDANGRASLAIDASGNPHISYYSSTDDDNRGLKYARWTGDDWDIQTISNIGGWSSSLALDANGYPHVSYHDNSNNILKYAHWTGSAWDIQDLDSAKGWSASLAVSTLGYLHISYFDSANNALKYAHGTGRAWDIQTVDSGEDVGQYNSLVLDSFGRPYICYTGGSDTGLKNAHWTGDTWDKQTLKDDGWNVNFSLALDASDRPHIGYHDRNDRELKYIHWTGEYIRQASRNIQTVDSSRRVNKSASLALDAFGSPHISYTSDGLRYARWMGDAWELETVDRNGSSGRKSLALDSTNRPHIGYSGKNQNLKYAHWTEKGWNIQTVDNAWNWSVSLALDTDDYPHISYYHRTDDDVELKYARWTEGSWDIQTVLSGTVEYINVDWPPSYTLEHIDGLTSLALDAYGYPHISYYNNAYKELKYVYWTGERWINQTVDHVGDVGEYAFLQVDSLGHPHINYYDYTNGNLKYARWTGSAWDIQTVGSVKGMQRFSPPVLDAAGNLHIGYDDSSNGGLKYARWTGSAWDIQTVNSGSGAFISLAPDASDRLHISYISCGDLKYVAIESLSLPYSSQNEQATPLATISSQSPVNTPTPQRADDPTWDIQTVDNTQQIGTFLILDSSGYPHISHYNHGLEYVRWTENGWDFQAIDRDGDVGMYASLALDAFGYLHIGYYDNTNGDLKYAYWTGGDWNIQIVDSAGDVGGSTSLVVDASGHPHISYYKLTSDRKGVLKYAHWTGKDWNIQTVNSVGFLGWDTTSLALDASGNPHISYSDSSAYGLKYAHWTGSAWDIQTVDEAGYVGYRSSLALDVSSNPHISYYDWGRSTLKYAHWTDGAWNIQTVDSGGSMGGSTSLAVDASGNPHVGYYDDAHDDLKYAHWTGHAWDIQIVDGQGGNSISLALDASGRPHISYVTGSALKYARMASLPLQSSAFLFCRLASTTTATAPPAGTNPAPPPPATALAAHAATRAATTPARRDRSRARRRWARPASSGASGW